MRMLRLLLFVAVLAGLSSALATVPTLINYQGMLTDGSGNALDTTADVTFRIFDVSSGGVAVWTETQSVTSVDGLFTKQLGALTPLDETIIAGPSRYLETQLGAAPFSPRTQLVSSPYSFRVATVDASSGGNISGKVNIGEGNSNLGSYAFVAGQSSYADGDFSFVAGQENSAVGHFSIVSGGSNNSAEQYAATIGGGSINQALGVFSTISGGTGNTVANSYGTIGGGVGNSAAASFSTVAGGNSNIAGLDASDSGSFVGGGGSNSATNIYATVGGGNLNTATSTYATVGGGIQNNATGNRSTVAGGWSNTAGGQATTVGGGQSNLASNNWGTIGGGSANRVSGDYATVPGGVHNWATGHYALAAGTQAKANHMGAVVVAAHAFVNNDTIASSGIGQMVLRADSGIYLTNLGGTANIPVTDFLNTSTGAHLTTGGAWTNASDKNSKENFCDINEQNVLEKVSELEITEWNYKAEGDEIKHIGPVAQEFYEKFGLGTDDKSISTVDASGVALAAIKALYQENQELKKRLEKLESEIK